MAFEALHRGEWLTDISLRDYLRDKVEKFIREETQINDLQRPYALLQASHTFQILSFVEEESAPIAELQVPKLLPEKAFFRRQEKKVLADFQASTRN